MSDYMTKRVQALEACDKVINGIEEGTISVSFSLLLCKKIARLVNDIEGQEWLGYEYGGYPRDNKGYILHNAWQIGAKHGRAYKEKDKNGRIQEYMFSDLCGELEASIGGGKKHLGGKRDDLSDRLDEKDQRAAKHRCPSRRYPRTGYAMYYSHVYCIGRYTVAQRRSNVRRIRETERVIAFS